MPYPLQIVCVHPVGLSRFKGCEMGTVDYSGIVQGTEELRQKNFEPINKLTPSHER